MSIGEKLNAGLKKVNFKRRPEILLSGTIPTPMHGLAPRVVLGEEWWNKTRKAAYRSTLFHCIACGIHKFDAVFHQWLEGHEVYRINYRKGRMAYLETVPLCHACHNYIHSGRLKRLLKDGYITSQKYHYIISHGEWVLQRSGLSIPTTSSSEVMAPWDKWRLIIGDQKYPPLYSEEEYNRRKADGRFKFESIVSSSGHRDNRS